jgi:hypothetical protein
MLSFDFINPVMSVFVSDTNTITPLIMFSIQNFYEHSLLFFNILQISLQTAVFIIKEVFTEASTNFTIDKIIYIISIYNLFMILYLDIKQQRKIVTQNEEIESLKKQINHSKKLERMREELEEIQNKEFKTYCEETNKKILSMGKKIKKLENELNMYQ